MDYDTKMKIWMEFYHENYIWLDQLSDHGFYRRRDAFFENLDRGSENPAFERPKEMS